METDAEFIFSVAQPEWGEEISIGENVKVRRPLNSVAKEQLARTPVMGIALIDLHDHFEARIKALEAEITSMKKDST